MPTVKNSKKGKHIARQRKLLSVKGGRGRRVSINILPGEVLLEIFDFYMTPPQKYSYRDQHVDAWHTLVHVCQRWRYVVFDSPRRLDLRLLCTNRTPVTNMLDIWPALPISIYAYTETSPLSDATNIISALQQYNRVCTITIEDVPNSLLKEFVAMQEPFPALTELSLASYDENAPVLPDAFLGGSALHLRSLELSRIPFPGLPKLLLSTHDLVTLNLRDIPRSGYISPEAMGTALSTLTGLEKLILDFLSPRSQADRASRRPPPLTRHGVVLPTLTALTFKGDSEYLEDIVSRLEAPLLSHTEITFFNQLVFDTPLLRHFISRTAISRTAYQARISCHPNNVLFSLYPRDGTEDEGVTLSISCKPLDWQISSLAQVCSSSFPPLPTLERLDIDIEKDRVPLLEWQDDMGDTQWLELLRPFTSVKDLTLSKDSDTFVGPALQELSGERVTEVLPALENLFLTGPMPSRPRPVREAILKFSAARQLAGFPVTVHNQGTPIIHACHVPGCGKRFTLRQMLLRHLREVHRVRVGAYRDWHCVPCGQSWPSSRGYMWKRHLIKVHPEVNDADEYYKNAKENGRSFEPQEQISSVILASEHNRRVRAEPQVHPPTPPLPATAMTKPPLVPPPASAFPQVDYDPQSDSAELTIMGSERDDLRQSEALNSTRVGTLFRPQKSAPK